MRLVQVAKILGMTGQELRKELSSVNLGVRPTDREVPDQLARGVIRFFAHKKGITVNMDDLGSMEDVPEEDDQEEEKSEQEQPAAPAAQDQKPTASASPLSAVAQATPTTLASSKPTGLRVMRKLTLEGVSQEAIARQEKQLQGGRKPDSKRPNRGPIVAKKSVAERDQVQIKRKEGPVELPDMITVKELAEKTGVQVGQIIQALMRNGVLATITQSIDFDTAAIVANELGVTAVRIQHEATAEELITRNLEELLKDDPENLLPRAPIVVVMGHVDHGKTSLLDAIRSTDVVKGEAGGITQHIGAYQVEHESSIVKAGTHKITFLDTPGHEAFTAMRARGAQVTDIVILVVSAEEGVKATTVEALDHAKDAGVPIIVAITKIDKERADIDRVKGEVAGHGLQPEEWGGTVPFVACSAVTKVGVNDILDHILLIAEEKKLSANPNRQAVATVIESHLDSSMGPLTTVLVNTGTLNVGDVIVCGQTLGRVKALIDSHGKRLKTLGPSGAARLSGLESVPTVGDILQVVDSEKTARKLQDALIEHAGRTSKRSFADLVARLSEGKLKQLKVVLKTDAQGSLEALEEALSKLTGADDATVTVKVIHGAVGAVSESDVMMAAASQGVVMAFHVGVPAEVRRTAEREGVKVSEYDILYELLDEVQLLLSGLVVPVEEEVVLGHLEIRGVFFKDKSDQIVGGKVTDGILKRVQCRLVRAGAVIDSGRIMSLKHIDKDIKEAKEGQECGMKVEMTTTIEEGDILEAFNREFKKKAA